IVSPIRGSNDGMAITILERLQDGSIKNHNEAAQADRRGVDETGIANVSSALSSSGGDGG
ncbi:MAG: hypothetical protein AAGH49_11730, partial [Pseudomonadota bacterium]